MCWLPAWSVAEVLPGAGGEGGRDAELAQWARAELATGWKGLAGWAAAAASSG